MFVDELELSVRGGRGGDGVVSFRREKYVPKGGPDGGDGGDGGSVYLWADPSKHSFLDLRYKRILKAPDGNPGRSKNRHGASGANLYVPVPLGTIIRDQNRTVLADLVTAKQCALVAPGGKGGKGNARFASSRRRVPRLAEKGLPGVEREISLELKLIVLNTDTANQNIGIRLTMALLAAVIFLRFILENYNLPSTADTNNFAFNLTAFEVRFSYLSFFVID